MAIANENIILKLVFDDTDADGIKKADKILESMLDNINEISNADLADDLTKQLGELQKATEDEIKAQKKHIKTLEENEKQTKKTTKSVADFEGVQLNTLKTLNEWRDALEEHLQTLDITSDAFEETKKELQKTEKEIEKLTKTQKKSTEETEKQTKSILEMVRGITVFGVNVGEVIDKGKQWIGNIKNIGSTLRTVTKLTESQTAKVNGLGKGFGSGAKTATILLRSMNLLKVAFAATPIGALVLAFGALVGFFTRTTDGADKLSKVLGGLGAFVDVLATRASQLGGALVKVFSGDFEGAAEQAKAAVTGVNDEIKESIELSQQLVDLQRVISEETLNQEIETAELNKLIKEQNLIAENVTNSFKERENAAIRSVELSEELLINQQSYNDAAIFELDTRIKLEGNEINRLELEREKNSLIAKGFDIETAVLELQTTQGNKVNAIRKEAEASRQKEIADRQKIVDLLKQSERTLEDLEISLIPDDVDKKVAEIQLAANRAKEDFAKGLAGLSGEEAKPFIDKYGELVEDATKQAIRSVIDSDLQSLEGSLDIKIRLDSEEAQRLESEVKGIITALQESGEFNALDGLFDIEVDETRIKELSTNLVSTLSDETDAALDSGIFDTSSFSKIFQELTSPEFQDAAKQAFDSVLGLAQKSNENLINSLDTALSKSRENIAELEDVADKGGAEQLEAAEEREARLIELRERALEQQKKITAAQIALDQAAAIASTVRNIASNPLLAAVQIAALITGTAAAISQIKNLFSEVPSFYDGIEDFKGGNVDNRGGQIAVLHPRERVVPAAQNKPLLDLGISNVDLPRYAIEGYKAIHQRGYKISETPMAAFLDTSTMERELRLSREELKEMKRQQSDMIKALQSAKVEMNITNKGINAAVTSYRAGKLRRRK